MQPNGPSTLAFIAAVRRHGFLDAVGHLWREYGDIFQVKIGPRRLVFVMHPDMVEHVNIGARSRYEKMASYDAVRAFLTGQGLVASTGDLWRRQRKLMAPFFTPKGIRAYGDLMLRDSLRFSDHFHDLAGAGLEVEMGEEMTQITASIILKAMFSSDTIDSLDQMPGAVATMVDFVNRRSNGLPVPLWLPTRINKDYRAARSLVYRAVAGLIAERRAQPDLEADDLLARLMAAKDPETGERMSETLLRDEALTTFFAGHETTARTMTFTWYALAANPRIAARLHAELDEALGERAPTMEDLRKLPYTLQVVKEVLRLYPAAPFYVRDAVEDDVMAGYDIKAGTAVMLSPYYTHRHPQFWREPENFEPDRFREGEAPRHGHAYHPFATGGRVCIGNNFSLLESHILLAVLAQRFEPRLLPGYKPQWEMRGVLNLAGGLPMKIVQRPLPPRRRLAGVPAPAMA